jgi:hypothetical protein
MTLPNRLELVEEFSDLPWEPRPVNPVGQAVTEAVIRQRQVWDGERP